MTIQGMVFQENVRIQFKSDISSYDIKVKECNRHVTDVMMHLMITGIIRDMAGSSCNLDYGSESVFKAVFQKIQLLSAVIQRVMKSDGEKDSFGFCRMHGNKSVVYLFQFNKHRSLSK